MSKLETIFGTYAKQMSNFMRKRGSCRDRRPRISPEGQPPRARPGSCPARRRFRRADRNEPLVIIPFRLAIEIA
jgi:hypothetical protein